MAEHQLTVASAVIVPEQSASHKGGSANTKRPGPSLVSETEKRVRLSSKFSEIAVSSTHESSQVDRRLSGAMEERKRGKRLFGALLGTLSQSSSSAAEKRRVDIEKKQLAKLKSQSDHFDEKRKQTHDALQEVRKEEQQKYERQSLLVRQSNELSMAYFLTTDTKPQLYYKPWELLPEEKVKIASQIGVVEAHVDDETQQDNVTRTQSEGLEAARDSKQAPSAEDLGRSTVGDIANTTVTPDQSHSKLADPVAATVPDVVQTSSKPHEREQTDENIDVIDGDEDVVIY